MTASKNDKTDKKPAYQYIHKRTLDELGLAMLVGEDKYGCLNFAKGHDRSQLLAAAIRHIISDLSGEVNDPDCTARLGKPVTHLGCALANINMLLFQEEIGTLRDTHSEALAELGVVWRPKA